MNLCPTNTSAESLIMTHVASDCEAATSGPSIGNIVGILSQIQTAAGHHWDNSAVLSRHCNIKTLLQARSHWLHKLLQ